MYLLNRLGIFLESCFPDSWLELQGVTYYKKAHEVIKITVVSVLRSFQLGFPFYFSLSILQWKDIKVATRDIIPLRPSAFWSQLTSI